MTKVLQNSQQQLEFLQSKLEHFQKDEILYLDSSPEIKKKRKAQKEITPKKMNSIKRPRRFDKNSPVTYPNTMDNYLILKGNKVTPSEEKASKPETLTEVTKLDEFQMGSDLKNRDKSEIINSWTNSCNFPFNEILCETVMKPDREDLKKSLVRKLKYF